MGAVAEYLAEERGTTPRIIVVGSTMIDLIAYADVLPGPGQTLEGREFQMGFGGKGANQAVMAARLGAEVIFVNRVGDDLFGSLTIQNLEQQGIDTRHVAKVQGASSGVAPIWVEPDGSNRIIIVPGANMSLTAKEVRRDLEYLDGADCVVCQLEIQQAAVVEAFRCGRGWGAVTVLNPAPATPIDDDVLELADWIIPNETEFETILGAKVDDQALLDADDSLKSQLLITLGSRGAVGVLDGKITQIEPPSVEAVDTTGAGDAFVGGFAYGLACGLEAADAVRLGNGCGALSVRTAGTRSSFPSREAVLELL